MPSVKILHLADLHIGAAVSGLGTRAESRRAETLITFERIIALAKAQKVDILLIAGDLFHSNRIEKSFIDRVFECFALIPEIKIVFAAGNHDPLSFESPFTTRELPDNLHILDTEDSFIEFPALSTRVYGKSFKEVYMAGSRRFSLETDDNFINIMCIHGELKADLNSNYNPLTAEFIENCGMDYVALGHIHKRTEIGKIGNTYCAYCGCGEGQGFDELGQKGVYLGEVSKTGCDLQFVPTAKRMHIAENVDISDVLSSTEIADKILETLRDKYSDSFADNLYKIVLTGSIDEQTVINLAEIESRLNEFLYFAKVRNKTQLAIDLEVLAQEKTLKGIFVKKMLEKLDSASDEEKPQITAALQLGLRAFNTEVAYDED